MQLATIASSQVSGRLFSESSDSGRVFDREARRWWRFRPGKQAVDLGSFTGSKLGPGRCQRRVVVVVCSLVVMAM